MKLVIFCMILRAAAANASTVRNCITASLRARASVLLNKNHFVNFTGAIFAFAIHVYTYMHKGRLHQQVCRTT